MSAYEQIDVVIHPQSVVHSAVQFVDGSLKAQLGTPDMRLPIQYALTYPDRRPSPAAAPDLVAIARLDFRAPDESRFPALRIARDAGRMGPRATAALIAADDVAVARFLDGTLDFPGIPRLLEDAVARFGTARHGREPDLDELIALDAEVRAAFGAGRRRRAEPRRPRLMDGLGLDRRVRPLHRHPRRARARPRARALPHRQGLQRPGPRVRLRLPAARKVLRSKGETLWTLNWLPIGGFVRMEGEDGDAADDPRSFAAQAPGEAA